MIDYIFTSDRAREVYGGELRRATEGAAGFDLYAVTIEGRKIGFGVAVELPWDAAGFVFARSGVAKDFGLQFTNGVGVIDRDYRGELRAYAKHNVPASLIGCRVAQLVVIRNIDTDPPRLVERLTPTQRGFGGFGSTGNG